MIGIQNPFANGGQGLIRMGGVPAPNMGGVPMPYKYGAQNMQPPAQSSRFGGLLGLGGLDEDQRQGMGQGFQRMAQQQAPPPPQAFMPQAQMGQTTNPQIGPFQMPQPGSPEYMRLMMMLRGGR